jgi:hypothetical protein
LGRVAGLLHEKTALAHQSQPVLKANGPASRQRCELTKRQPGGGFKLQIGDLLPQQLPGNPADQENARLRMLGFGKFGFRA